MTRLGGDRRGTAIMEFALLAPVLMMIICATIELGYHYMAQTSLTGAVSMAARTSAVTQESSQEARNTKLRAAIAAAMSMYPVEEGKHLTITPTSYAKFGDTFPEQYTDANGNGRYDAPLGPFLGEPFVDRNGNGRWDSAVPKAADSTGEVGDVVSYVATYPLPHMFQFLSGTVLSGRSTNLTAVVVVRNEPVRTE